MANTRGVSEECRKCGASYSYEDEDDDPGVCGDCAIAQMLNYRPRPPPEKQDLVILWLPSEFTNWMAPIVPESWVGREAQQGRLDRVEQALYQVASGDGASQSELRTAAKLLSQSGYKKMGARLRAIALDPPPQTLEPAPRIHLPLSEEELNGLGWLADRYTSARLLYDAYDDESGTFDTADVVDAYRATPGDGGDLGTVPNAGGSLAEKIQSLWDQTGAFYQEEDED